MVRLTYRDAVKILGAGNSALVSALDKILGGLLLGAAPFAPDLLSILGAKSELTRLAHDLVNKGIDKRRRVSQFDRIQRLHAARGVLMVTSYFEAVEYADLPFRVSSARISREESIGLAVRKFDAKSLASVVTTILDADLPLLGVQVDSASAREELGRFYQVLSDGFLKFLKGLSLWDDLDATQQLQLTATLERVPPIAVRSFDNSMQRLAADCPEFAIWLNLSGHRITHHRLEDVYDAVQALLTRAKPVDRVPLALQGVVRFNRSAKSRKLLSVDEIPDGLDAPTVGKAYVDPHFKMAEVNAQAPVNNEDFWSNVDVRMDFNEFLIGYLLTPWACVNPLIILGHPGAGKSLLTEVQAARLPSPDFVSIRVPLRDVPADVDIHEQIEHAVGLFTHESVSWSDLARAASGSLLVVLLDGFDELLQATGVSKSDYLMQVKRFQEVEETQGRHVAVIVTSRVAVADRMRIPNNTVAVRLEPFDLNQVERWVEVWNETNHNYLIRASRGFLDLDTIETYLDLASQPLLLLMLAVYDAESGALRAGSAGLSQTELYERLLRRFAHREVSKWDGLPQDDPLVERELLILSVIAFGMFNRGAQWITDAQLADDLAALQVIPPSQQVVTATHHRLAGEARDALGRFFYIHRARTTVEGVELGTYEFMHATFGEYLAVRLTWRCLKDMVDRAHVESGRLFTAANQRVNDVELRAFLSWSLLSVRMTMIEFLEELVSAESRNDLAAMRSVLMDAFRVAYQPEIPSTYYAYRPVDMTYPARLATYSANLIILMMTIGPDVSSDELFPDALDHADEWARFVQLWRSQLRSGEWSSLADLYTVTRLGNRATGRSVRLGDRQSTRLLPQYFNCSWTLAPSIMGGIDDYQFQVNFFRSAEFMCDPDIDLVANALGGPESLLAQLLPYHIRQDGELKSVVADLIATSLFHVNRVSQEARLIVYDRITRFAVDADFFDDAMRRRFASQVLQILVNDDLVPSAYVLRYLDSSDEALHSPDGMHNLTLLLRLLSRTSESDEFLQMLDTMLELNEVSLEDAAEIWCALADKGISSSRYPIEIRDQAHSLHWPERDISLAHRPDLLKRLSALEDEELL